jgi:hypothetical protein
VIAKKNVAKNTNMANVVNLARKRKINFLAGITSLPI